MYIIQQDRAVAPSPLQSWGNTETARQTTRLVMVGQFAQRCRIANHQSRTLRLQDLTLLHVRKQPGDRLSRSSDHLRDFLMRKAKLQPGLRFSAVSVLGAPLQQQLSQL